MFCEPGSCMTFAQEKEKFYPNFLKTITESPEWSITGAWELFKKIIIKKKQKLSIQYLRYISSFLKSCGSFLWGTEWNLKHYSLRSFPSTVGFKFGLTFNSSVVRQEVSDIWSLYDHWHQTNCDMSWHTIIEFNEISIEEWEFNVSRATRIHCFRSNQSVNKRRKHICVVWLTQNSVRSLHPVDTLQNGVTLMKRRQIE